MLDHSHITATAPKLQRRAAALDRVVIAIIQAAFQTPAMLIVRGAEVTVLSMSGGQSE